MVFTKKRGDNHYCVLGCNKGFDYNVDCQLQNDLWEPYKMEPWFYQLVVEYYEEHKGNKGG